MPEEASFPDIDDAFADLANSSPIYPPGADVVRRTIQQRRRRRRRGVQGLAAAVILVMLVGIGVGALRRNSEPTVIRIDPAASGSGQWWPSPLPSDPSQLREITVQAFTFGEQRISIPSGEAGCPAATLQFRTNLEATAKGVKYTLHALTAAYGDLTGDDHNEMAVVISCQLGKRTNSEIVVITAMDGAKTATLALGHIDSKQTVAGMAILRGYIVTYSHKTIQNPATEIQRYLPVGDGRLAVEGPTVTPTS
jgi:hypothetical protein